MFQPRQLLKRRSASAPSGAAAPAKLADSDKLVTRHPAMRGLDVSPVHGRHCICSRCEQHQNAA